MALLFDSLVSPFWVSGLDIMRDKAKENGWQMLENISNFDDNKQFEQVKAMIGRKVDGILIIQTDSKAVIPAIRAANDGRHPDGPLQPPAGRERRLFGRDPGRQPQDHAARPCSSWSTRPRSCGKQVQGRDHDRRPRRRERDPAPRRLLRRRRQEQGLVEVVARISTEWNADKAFAGLTNAFQANPDINFLFTSSDFMLRRSSRC